MSIKDNAPGNAKNVESNGGNTIIATSGNNECQRAVASGDSEDGNNTTKTQKKFTPDSNDAKESEPVISLACRERYFSWRYIIVLLLSVSFTVSVFGRNCMPIALVCMTHPIPVSAESESQFGVELANISLSHYANRSNETGLKAEFSFDVELQGLILSSPAWLSFLAPLITNALQPYLGHKKTLTVLMSVCVVLVALTPTAARISPWLLLAFRALTGATFGSNVPVIGDFVARWAPKNERQTMITYSFMGMHVGDVLVSLVSGYLCIIPIDNGWPFIFYFIAVSDMVWLVMWYLFGSNGPESHKYISDKEREYILKHRSIKETSKSGKPGSPPYRVILTSPPVIAYLVCGSLQFWLIFFFKTNLAMFMSTVLGLSPTDTGILMSLLSVVVVFSMTVWTTIINRMLKIKQLTTTRSLKIVLSCGVAMTIAALMSIIFFDVNNLLVTMALVYMVNFGLGCGACVLPAIPQALAPRYAGFITGLFFSLGGLLSSSAPLIVAAITPDSTAEEWRYVWIMMVSIACLFWFVFVTFVDCNIQPWAVEHLEDTPEVVSPFDQMNRRFSGVLQTPPFVLVDVTKDNTLNFTIEVEK